MAVPGAQCSGPQHGWHPISTHRPTSDFNGDNLPDVLTIVIPGINCRQGKGDGTFAAPVPVSLPAAIADFRFVPEFRSIERRF